MLFLLRPRQTYMPYALPRDPEQQAARNEQRERAYAETRRLPPSEPSTGPDVVGRLEDLAALRASGAISDDEFTALKAKLLDA